MSAPDRSAASVAGEAATASAAQSPTDAGAALLKSSAVYVLANFGTRAMNFLLLPLYTRFLSPADYGTISLAEIAAAIFIGVASLGMVPGLARSYFQYPEGSQEQRDYVSSVLRFCSVVLAGALAIAFLIAPALQKTFPATRVVPFLPYVALALATATAIQVMQYAQSLYQLQRRPVSYARLAIALYVLTAAACVAFVVGFHGGAAGMLAGKLAAASVMAIAGFLALRSWLRGRWQWNYVRETLPLALPLMPHQLMALGLVIADRFLLEHYRTLSEVGIYSLAYTCGMAMFLLVNSVLQSWAPEFFDLGRGGDAARPRLAELNSRLAAALAAVAVVGVLVTPLFVRLLDPRYAALARLIPLVIAGYLFHGFFALLQLSIMQSKRSQFILYASSLALAGNLLLNFLWIPRWGMVGAAYATIAGYALEALATYFFAQRVYRLPFRLRRPAAALIVFAVLTAWTQIATLQRTQAIGMAVAALLAVWLLWMLFSNEIALSNQRRRAS